MIKYSLIILMLIATVSADQSNGIMTRTTDKIWYFHGETINVSLTPSGDANFTAWNATENIPEGFNMSIYPHQTSVSLSENTFTGLSPAFNNTIYQLTQSISIKTDKWYNITGTFTDFDRNTGEILSPNNKGFYIVGNTTRLIINFDKSDNNRLEKPEILNVVSEYFNNNTLDFNTTIQMVDIYLKNSSIIPLP